MNKEEAVKILEALDGSVTYEAFYRSDSTIVLDGRYNLQQLEAFVWWCKHPTEWP